MIDESSLLPNVHQVERGYLCTPADMDLVKNLTDFDEYIDPHTRTGWSEYSISAEEIYPYFLTQLAKAGIAFGWEYQHTEDMSYFAYNFPTEEQPVNLHHFSSIGKRKQLPYLNKTKRSDIETTSAANELLYQMGINYGTC